MHNAVEGGGAGTKFPGPGRPEWGLGRGRPEGGLAPGFIAYVFFLSC